MDCSNQYFRQNIRSYLLLKPGLCFDTFWLEESWMFSRLGVLVCELWIVNCELWVVILEGESDWNDYNVCLSGLSSLYAKDELSISIFRGSLSRALPPSLFLYIYKEESEEENESRPSKRIESQIVCREKEGLVFWVGQSSRPLFICRSESNDAFQKLPRENQLERRRRRKKKRRCTLNSIICCISKYTFVLNFCKEILLFLCFWEEENNLYTRDNQTATP